MDYNCLDSLPVTNSNASETLQTMVDQTSVLCNFISKPSQACMLLH